MEPGEEDMGSVSNGVMTRWCQPCGLLFGWEWEKAEEEMLIGRGHRELVGVRQGSPECCPLHVHTRGY